MSFNFLSSMPFPRRRLGTPDLRIEPAFDARRIAGTHPTRGMPDIPRLLAAAKKPPQLAMIEWNGDGSTASANEDLPDAGPMDPMRRRIRDRYIGARFPGVARCAADLADAPRVVKAARLYFEEEDLESALELLALAVEEAPETAELWLARLEILFLSRDAEGFAEAARGFRGVHANDPEWAEVLRLGRALAPSDPLFQEGGGVRAHDHYGPWPDLPNWIQAPWDLTAEVQAADFHRAVRAAIATRGLAPPLAA